MKKVPLRDNPYCTKPQLPVVKSYPEKALKREISALRSALKELISEMRDFEMIKKYRAVIEKDYSLKRRIVKSSKFIGVSLASRDTESGLPRWRMRIVINKKEYKEYFKDELSAARRHDELLLKHRPEDVRYLNFIPEGWTEEDCKPPPNLHDKRKFISQFASTELVKKFSPAGLGYVTIDACDKIIECIEETSDNSLEEWHRRQK